MSTVTIGLECKAYLLSTGTRATWSATVANGIHTGPAPSSLTEASVIRNATLNLGASEADVSSRASLWKLTRKALRELDIDLELPWTPADAIFAKLLGAFLASGSSVAMAFLDGDKATVGAQGIWADFEVFEFTRDESLEKEVMAKVKLKPTATAVPPEWVSVTGP